MGSGTSESILNINNIGLVASTTAGGRNCLFVREGSLIHFEGVSPSWAWFYPLVY
jgi:hypothetical protein